MESLLGHIRELLRAHRWREAITLLTPQQEGLRDEPELSWSLGWAHFKLQEFEAAVGPLRRACEQVPNVAAYHWTLAFALLEIGEVEAAEMSFKRALKLADSQLAWSGLALLYLRAGDLNAAERTHQAAMQRKPESRERVEAYADFLSDTGRQLEAREQYSRAATLWPESRTDVH